MSKRTSRRKKVEKTKTIFEQVLSVDYWEGFYVLDEKTLVRCTDVDGTSLEYSLFSILTGKETTHGSFPIKEGDTFRQFADHVRNEHGMNITMRISDALENPDRHEEIERILSTGDRFQTARVQNLIKRIRCKGICVFGGRIGGRLLEEGDYEGFYLLEDGKILFCREATHWDETCMNGVVDAVVSYHIVDTNRFELSASGEQFYGYLAGDRFSDFASTLAASHGRVVSEIAVAGDELYDHLCKALDGNQESAAIASHRLKMNLCIRQ